MTRRIKRNIALMLLVVGVVVASKIVILDNPTVLFSVAAGLDEPSTSFYIVTERIYKLSETKDLGKKLLDYLEKGKNQHLHGLYIRTLGIIGEDSPAAITCLLKTYVKYQDNTKQKGIVYRIIDSIGFVGDETTVSVLERLLSNYGTHRMVVPRYVIARALYLSTGKNYDYVDDSGTTTKLHLTDELREASKVVEISRGRHRTFGEMVALDNLNRPDKYKK